jgi:hypothetical protein
VLTTVACNECRAGKARCDGARPSCAKCALHGIPCIYEVPQSKANVTKTYYKPLQTGVMSGRYVQRLHERIRILEHQLNSQKQKANGERNGSPVPIQEGSDNRTRSFTSVTPRMSIDLNEFAEFDGWGNLQHYCFYSESRMGEHGPQDLEDSHQSK